MASGTDTTSVSGNAGQAALDRFAGMMIERMRQMKDTGWKQGWIGGASGFAGLPQNVSGRNYSGSNSFFLQLQTAAMGYRLPVYLTFKQAHNLKAHVLKGEKAFPVVYWDMMVKDKYGKRISSEEYRALGKEEKKGMEVIPFIKAFPVYNVQQTNLAEIQPERMQKLQDKFKVPELRDTAGMYAHSALDRMVETQAWLCPIQVDKRVDGAYYSPSKDHIVLPMKAQFNIGGTPEDTYRGGMDFDSKVTDNSAAYLDSWIGVLKQEPKFIVSVMADVNKASDLILDHVDKQRLALGEQPYLAKNDPLVPLGPDEEVPFKNAAIVKTRSGGYAIRASYDGVELGLKNVSKETAKTYFQLTDMKDKAAFLHMTARKTYGPELAVMQRTQKTGTGISMM